MNKVTEEDVESHIREVEFTTMGKKTTVCTLTMKNGYEVTGLSACVDPKDFDESIGCNIAKERAKEKIWELLGYMRQETLT